MREITEVARDIINTEFSDDVIVELNDVFFKLMRKHNIKRGTMTEGGGILTNNYEWTMCREFFVKRVESALIMSTLFGGVPEDLRVTKKIKTS